MKANPTLGQLGLPLDERGRVRVDPLLRVEGHERLWALGDGAAVPNQATPGRVDPPTCQHALRQARALAKNLTGEPRPYAYRMLGQVATLGRYKGIADVLGIRIRGFPGWFVTRSYHLFQLPLVKRKIRVVVDWTTSLFFRRDIAELSGLGHPHRASNELGVSGGNSLSSNAGDEGGAGAHSIRCCGQAARAVSAAHERRARSRAGACDGGEGRTGGVAAVPGDERGVLRRPASLEQSGGKDEMLGFGVDAAVMLVTPVALAVAKDVIDFLGEQLRAARPRAGRGRDRAA